MLTEQDLNKCIDNLAEINANVNSAALKHLALEVGYILKQELDNVVRWNAQFKDDRHKGYGNIDVKKLLEDNIQLCGENKQLQDLNLKLKEVIDKRIPKVEEAIANIGEKVTTFSELVERA